MSIKDILKEHANAAFAERVNARLQELNLTPKDFGIQVYGYDKDGQMRGGGQVYSILRGKARAAQKTLARWAPVLQMSVAELQRLYDEPEASSPRALAIIPDAPPKPKPAGETAVTLTVSTTGRASLRLNLVDIPIQHALRIIELVQWSDERTAVDSASLGN